MKKEKEHNKPAPGAYANMLWLRCKLAWVEWMDSRSRGMGRKQQYMALLAFVAITFSICLFLIFGGLANITHQLRIAPARIEKVVTGAEHHAPVIEEDTVIRSRIHTFHLYMDSLARSPSGRLKRDSIVRARPGLLDSIALAEKIINNKN